MNRKKNIKENRQETKLSKCKKGNIVWWWKTYLYV